MNRQARIDLLIEGDRLHLLINAALSIADYIVRGVEAGTVKLPGPGPVFAGFTTLTRGYAVLECYDHKNKALAKRLACCDDIYSRDLVSLTPWWDVEAQHKVKQVKITIIAAQRLALDVADGFLEEIGL